MLGEAASRALRNSTPDPSFGGPEFFCADTAAGAGLNAAGTGAGSGNRSCRERGQGRAGSGNGNVPGKERRGGDRSGERPAGAEGRGTSAGSNRKRCRTSPQGLNSGQTMPPSRMLTRITPPPTSAPSPPRRHPLLAPPHCPLPPFAPYLCQLPLACTTTRPVSAPLRPLLLSSGRAEEAPRRAGHRLPSPKYAQPTHRPNTHKKRAASAAGCRPMERMRRLYSRSSPVSSATGGS